MTYSDQELLAFLNGELDDRRAGEIEQTMRVDQDLESRVMALDPVAGPVRDAMMSLPGDQVLRRIEDAALSPRQSQRESRHLARFAAVLVLGATLGAGAMWLGTPRADDWRGRVAQYQSLYVADTVRLTTASSDALTRQIGAAADSLGRPLDLSALEAPSSLKLARVQVLGLDEAPLIQIVYTDDDGKPYALCITTGGEGDEGSDASSEMLHGLATTAWQDGDFRFIFVGGEDLSKTGRIADQLKAVL
ncbi:hypothetical protein [uncultured Roseibium sp.]|uniref:hypothetical protein n=1 Tax=uncultured Roseibium sp. TaxID=1936171 RepID=UPI00261BF1A9|nr:hypothetical protein [uncultured Roseibium sp.]